MSAVRAPWTPEQVEYATAWQHTRHVHPYTCRNRDGHPLDPEGDYGVLVATEKGWVCRHCDYTQDWAHDYTFQPPQHHHGLNWAVSHSDP